MLHPFLNIEIRAWADQEHGGGGGSGGGGSAWADQDPIFCSIVDT